MYQLKLLKHGLSDLLDHLGVGQDSIARSAAKNQDEIQTDGRKGCCVSATLELLSFFLQKRQIVDSNRLELHSIVV